MSCPNFQNQPPFPLIIIQDVEGPIEGVDEVFIASEQFDYMDEICGELNPKLRFHTVIVQAGYYSDIQFYVQTDKESNPESASFKKDVERIQKWLIKMWMKHDYFVQLKQEGIFSNGEAIYSIIKRPEKTVKGAK